MKPLLLIKCPWTASGLYFTFCVSSRLSISSADAHYYAFGINHKTFLLHQHNIVSISQYLDSDLQSLKFWYFFFISFINIFAFVSHAYIIILSSYFIFCLDLLGIFHWLIVWSDDFIPVESCHRKKASVCCMSVLIDSL